MSVDQSLVSIGVPVFNGGTYLRGALESLVGQDYKNIELIISDNGSTDRTEEICREYEAHDPRIRYFRSEKNEGIFRNFQRVFELSTGVYFMWAAYDDLWDPSFVRKCKEMLESTPDAALICTNVRIIDEEGNKVSEKALIGASAPDRATRVRQFLSCHDLGYPTYGLARRETFERLLPLQPFWGTDFIFLTKLCLLGAIGVVPEALFSYRTFQNKTYNSTMPANLFPESSFTMIRHYKNIYFEVLRAISASQIPRWERRKIALIAAVTLGKQWPRWIKICLEDYAYPKYLLPAIKNREKGNRKLAAWYALRAMAANPLYILSRAWVIPIDGVLGPRLAALARRFARGREE